MSLTGYGDFWFRAVPLPKRAERFAALGIRHLDVWAWRSKGTLMDELADACQQHGCVINSTFDDAGGSLTDAQDHARCLDAWAESLERAQRWGVQHLFMFSEQIEPVSIPTQPHIQGWVKRPSRDYTPQQKFANLLEGAARVMALVERTPIVVWFEALNTYHLHGGVTVCTHELAAEVVRRINHPQLRLAFDCYHQQRTAGNLIQGLRDYWGLYDSVHIGDVPTRQEPGTGEINFVNLMRELKRLGFAGKIGLEFYPSTTEAEALERVRALIESA
ncbi:MAG: TIM barrel protein [Thermoflexales bacterium]|nr:TIM barrel protein [Thermoflexales bacterium]